MCCSPSLKPYDSFVCGTYWNFSHYPLIILTWWTVHCCQNLRTGSVRFMKESFKLVLWINWFIEKIRLKRHIIHMNSHETFFKWLQKTWNMVRKTYWLLWYLWCLTACLHLLLNFSQLPGDFYFCVEHVWNKIKIWMMTKYSFWMNRPFKANSSSFIWGSHTKIKIVLYIFTRVENKVENFLWFTGGQDIKLVNGLDGCFGTVEVLNNGTWGTVCDDSWDIIDASVVCRQLGCGRAISAHGQALFGVGRGQVWMKSVDCLGSESFISNCSHAKVDCDHSNDAGVVCSGMRISVLPWSKCLFASMLIHWDFSLFVTLCLSVFAHFNLCDRLEHERNQLQFLRHHTKLPIIHIIIEMSDLTVTISDQW